MRNILYPIAITLALGFIYKQYKKKEQEDTNQYNYALVRNYLLTGNECSSTQTALERSKKPILWIHSTYDVNARNWQSFNSRNTEELNQPYLYLCIKSIIHTCGGDFNVCLIDDDSFAKLLPGFALQLHMTADPIRTKLRQLALAKLLHHYGGLLVPNAFISFQNLFATYHKLINESQGGMFVGELLDRHSTSQQVNFFPSTAFMGCVKDSFTMAAYIHYLETLTSTDFVQESDFLGASNRWCYERSLKGDLCLLSAAELGAQDNNGKQITIDRLLGSTFVHLKGNVKGLYVPADEILNRTKYQWFARLSAEQVLASDTVIGKYLLISR
jgi:hypothetical protein